MPRWYEGDTDEARAARAILLKLTGGSEALPALERAAGDLPNQGLVQYHFGSIESQDVRVVPKRFVARTSRPAASADGARTCSVARVLILGGMAEEALPLLDRALSLEPESADRFYMLRAEALMSLRRFDEAYKTAKFAVTLPHGDRYGDRSTDAAYNQMAIALNQRIQDIQIAAERLQVEQLRETVGVEASRREPVKPPPPPRPPDRAGQIEYQYEATSPVEILKSVLPEYADALVKSGKAGKVVLQVNIGVDGLVECHDHGITDSGDECGGSRRREEVDIQAVPTRRQACRFQHQARTSIQHSLNPDELRYNHERIVEWS